MKKKKKVSLARTLNTTTMFYFLKKIQLAKNKKHIREFIDKIHQEKEFLRVQRIKHAFEYLQNESYIKLSHGVYPTLTEKGSLYLDMLSQQQKTYWDKRFRIILTEELNLPTNTKIYLRTRLHQYGFVQMTRGVWVYPYACDAFISFITIHYKLSTPLIHFIAQDNQSFSDIKKHFRLR